MQHAAASAETGVWVARSDGGISCEPEKSISLEAGLKELQAAGVRVLDSKKGSDGMLRAQVCGAPTGSKNTYLIAESDLAKATSIAGFKQLPTSEK